jgi:acetylornithine deacetylase/succinyl-diaminopimelate desuccinylase-like protein
LLKGVFGCRMFTVMAKEILLSELKKVDDRVAKNFDKQVAFLGDLVKEKSMNPGIEGCEDSTEEKVARLIRSKLREMDVVSRYLRSKKKRPNLVVSWGPTRSRKSLLLTGHMDTDMPVAEEKSDWFSGEVENGKMYGAGVLDMKASLSAYVFALKALKDMGLKLDGKLKLAFTVDGKSECASKLGLKYLVNKGLRAKVALLSKPGTDKIAVGHRGGYRFKISVKGEEVDTGRRSWEMGKKGKNAIQDMNKVVNGLAGFDLPFKPARAFPGRVPVFTFPTKMVGGRAVNRVPGKCEAWGDVRLLPGNTDSQVRWWMEGRLSKLKDVDWSLEDLFYVPAMEVDKTDRWVKLLHEQASMVLSTPPKLEGCGPWNDAWMLNQSDTPCLAGFGPDGDVDDVKGEWVDLDSLKQLTQIITRWILVYLGKK